MENGQNPNLQFLVNGLCLLDNILILNSWINFSAPRQTFLCFLWHRQLLALDSSLRNDWFSVKWCWSMTAQKTNDRPGEEWGWRRLMGQLAQLSHFIVLLASVYSSLRALCSFFALSHIVLWSQDLYSVLYRWGTWVIKRLSKGGGHTARSGRDKIWARVGYAVG